jgi:hypothetical protein
MADTKFLQERTVKFLNKDFYGFKRDLIKFSQAHHSGVFQDFNETAPGMAILEYQAAVGDSLAFYLDQAWSELKQDTARQIENAAAFAKSKGYQPRGKAAARGIQSFIIEVPSTVSRGAYVPDDLYAPILLKGAKVQGPNGVVFETLDNLNFATSSIDSPRTVTGSKFDQSTGYPTHFAIKKDVEIVAGETKTDTFTVGDFQQFLELELANEDVLEVISVVDSDGNDWYEVDYLSQDTVFDQESNTGDDVDIVPYVLKLRSVPRRFITDRNVLTNKTKLVFGSGDGINFDDELIPNLADYALPLAGRRTFTAYPLDPQNFLKTRSLGLSPYNTTLTVNYRVGGGSETNVPPGSISDTIEARFDFGTTTLVSSKKAEVERSLETINIMATRGGGPEETLAEIKANSDAFFAAQNRCVTPDDFITRALSLPARFGKPEKVFVKRTSSLISHNSIDIHVLANNSAGYLVQAPQTLLNNIKTYISRFKMMGDGVNLLQTNIINLALDFGIVVSPKFNRTEVLTKCLDVARNYLHTDNMQIGQPIVLSDLSANLQRVYGVISVYKLQFKNLFCPTFDESGYSTVRFSVRENTANGLLYCPEDSIFEIKFPTRDIRGECK